MMPTDPSGGETLPDPTLTVRKAMAPPPPKQGDPVTTLNRWTVYRTPNGREALLVGREHPTAGTYQPVRNAAGEVRVGYLGPNGEELSLLNTEYGWAPEADLTPLRDLREDTRCPSCMGTLGRHGMVHVRHGNGGGHNEPCPRAGQEGTP